MIQEVHQIFSVTDKKKYFCNLFGVSFSFSTTLDQWNFSFSFEIHYFFSYKLGSHKYCYNLYIFFKAIFGLKYRFQNDWSDIHLYSISFEDLTYVPVLLEKLMDYLFCKNYSKCTHIIFFINILNLCPDLQFRLISSLKGNLLFLLHSLSISFL